MPTITRWFRVSHDLNSDPEFWELREQFGDRAGYVWLEILSIADRDKGLLGEDSPQLHAVLGSKCRVYSPKVRAILGWCLGKGWLVNHDGLRVAKWAKYNKTRDVDESPSYTSPSYTSEPSETYKISSAEPSVDRFTERKWENLDEHIKAVADRIYASNPERFKKLITWIMQAKKYHYSDPVITEALLRFEPRAGEAARWYPYLDRIIDKVRADYDKRQSDQEHEQRKQGERELAGSLKLAKVVKDA